jgi:hypothetical protein
VQSDSEAIGDADLAARARSLIAAFGRESRRAGGAEAKPR